MREKCLNAARRYLENQPGPQLGAVLARQGQRQWLGHLCARCRHHHPTGPFTALTSCTGTRKPSEVCTLLRNPTTLLQPVATDR